MSSKRDDAATILAQIPATAEGIRSDKDPELFNQWTNMTHEQMMKSWRANPNGPTLLTACGGFAAKFAGLIGISGYAHQPKSLLAGLSPVARQQRFLVTHGTEDPLIPMALVRAQMKEFETAGLNIQWREFVKAHTIAGDEELRIIRDFVEHGYLSHGHAT